MSARGAATRSVVSAVVVAAALVSGSPRIAGQSFGAVEGTVTMVGGDGVPGALIELLGLSRQDVTDQDGRFTVQAVPSGRLTVHAALVGCTDVTTEVDIPAGRTVTLRVILDGPAVRHGSREPARGGAYASGPDQAQAVHRLGRDEIGRSPVRSVGDLIRGAFPSVKVVQGSGLPGSSLSIQVGGARSISGVEGPLLVIDGLVTGGGLDDLDPLDIESIEVRKGAGAAAVYGARGAAGVIEITTARGRPDPRSRCYLRIERGN